MKINDISTDRIDYGLGRLERDDLNASPIAQLTLWLTHARQAEIKDYNAFVLSTMDYDGFPSSRIVLLRDCDEQGLTFFTNYNSEKGQNIERKNKVCLNFFWSTLERQVRIWGWAEKVTEAESDAYFASRPRESQIGAWASQQSEVLSDRSVLDQAVQACSDRFQNGDVPRPPHWGGFRIRPQKFEFWQGRSSRLHDRFVYALQDAQWSIQRLNP